MKPNRIEFLTPAELLAVLRQARKESTRNWAMFLMAYSHGLRASEVCGLKLQHVDLKGGFVDVHRLKDSLRTIEPLQPHRGEPLLDEMKAVRAYLAERPADAGDALFVSQKGGAMSATQFYRIFRDVAAACGLPTAKRHPHVLKHSLATHLVQADVNLAKVQRYLGHAAITSTVRYTTISDQEASRDAHAALMNIF